MNPSHDPKDILIRRQLPGSSSDNRSGFFLTILGRGTRRPGY